MRRALTHAGTAGRKRSTAVFVLLSACLWAGSDLVADERSHTVSKDTVLQWVNQYQDATPEFQPGQTLTLEDLEKVRPFLPPGFFDEVAFPGVTIEIASTGDYAPHPVYRAATERFAGQTRLTADGALAGYVAGQPFLNDSLDLKDPTAGLKVAWNLNFRWQHYGQRAEKYYMALIRPGADQAGSNAAPEGFIGGGGELDRLMVVRFQRVYFSHLAMLPDNNYTLPAHGAAEVEYKEYDEFIEPYDVRGQRFVVQRARDPHLTDQAWAYVPAMRKVRRLSTEERADSFLGTEITYDDFLGYSGRIVEQDWTFHGWKDVLHIMNSRHLHAHFSGPRGWVPNDRWEVRRCIVLEQTPKDPSHPYSSKLLFLDAQTYRATTVLAFDREGKLWRVWNYQNSWSEDAKEKPEGNHGTFVARFLGLTGIDVQNQRATLVTMGEMDYPQVTVEEVEELYNLNRLTEGRR